MSTSKRGACAARPLRGNYLVVVRAVAMSNRDTAVAGGVQIAARTGVAEARDEPDLAVGMDEQEKRLGAVAEQLHCDL